MRFKVLLFLVLGGLTLADGLFNFHYQASGDATAIVRWNVSKAN